MCCEQGRRSKYCRIGVPLRGRGAWHGKSTLVPKWHNITKNGSSGTRWPRPSLSHRSHLKYIVDLTQPLSNLPASHLIHYRIIEYENAFSAFSPTFLPSSSYFAISRCAIASTYILSINTSQQNQTYCSACPIGHDEDHSGSSHEPPQGPFSCQPNYHL